MVSVTVGVGADAGCVTPSGVAAVSTASAMVVGVVGVEARVGVGEEADAVKVVGVDVMVVVGAGA